MRVLHIYKDYYPPTCGGIEIAINRIIEGTRDSCDEVSVMICGRKLRSDVAEVEGATVYRVGEWGRFLSAPVSPAFPLWLRSVQADILHYHIPNPTAVLSHLMARPRGKVIVHYHSDIVRQKNWLTVYGAFRRAFLRRADRIIVTSPNYLETSDTLPPFRDKCEIVPFGLPLARFAHTPEADQAAKTLRRRYGGRLVLFAGVQRYYKGLHVLLEAMERIDGRLLVVGDGPLLGETLNRVKTLPYSDRIIFVGRVESVIPYYYASDVFCLPSIYRSEAFGLVLIEAAACGLPLVSTELGTGTSYINLHEKTGLVVPPLDAGALAGSINRLLNDDALRERFGRAARERVEALFTQERMCQRILEIYRSVLG
ncbi:MAG: glycosyltransferase [bacterium]|nr:glycosyltransferase [bacterium]